MAKSKTKCVINADGTKIWLRRNRRHRDDGPAVEYTNGDKFWCQNGKYHRLDGPAIEWADGPKEWWQNGNYIKICFPKTFTYVRNKGTENEEEMEIELCCAGCAKLYYGISPDEFSSIKKQDV